MSDWYEEFASEMLAAANRADEAGREAFSELASELLSLARQAREAA